ncbi:MAG: MATE family efflux transporter [Elusimicrobiota bacterium]
MRDFTKGSVLEQLIAFSIPMLLANLLQAALGLINAIWVGRLLGHQAFAAVSSTMPIIFFFVSAIIGLTMATNILVGQAFGSKNMAFLAKVLSNSFMSSVVMCVFISALGFMFTPLFLHIMKTPADIVPDARIYLRTMFIGVTFTFIFFWFSGILRGLGDAKTPLYLLIVATVLNIVLVPLLIKGYGPMPGFGIEGAALAPIISNAVMVVLAYFFVLRTHVLLNVHSWDYAVDWYIIKKIFVIGIPMSLQMVLVAMSEIFVVSLVNSFGSSTTAAYGIGMQLDQLSFLPAMAIGMSVSSMAAQNLGAREFDRVKKILKLSILMSLALSTGFFIVIYSFPARIASIFTNEPQVIAITVGYIRIVSISYFFIAVMFALQGVVRGAGDTLYMFLFTLLGLVIIRYPIAVLLIKYTSLREHGIWIAIVLSTIISLALNYWYYRSGKWKNKVLVQKPVASV